MKHPHGQTRQNGRGNESSAAKTWKRAPTVPPQPRTGCGRRCRIWDGGFVFERGKRSGGYQSRRVAYDPVRREIAEISPTCSELPECPHHSDNLLCRLKERWAHMKDDRSFLTFTDHRLVARASAGFFSTARMSWLFLIDSLGSRQRISSNSFTPSISVPIEMLVTRSRMNSSTTGT